MAFDAGAVTGRLELAISGWQTSVATVKKDLDALAVASGLPTAQFGKLKDVISGLGISLKSELEAKLKAAQASLELFTKSGQLTAEGQKKLEANITGLKNELAGMTGETETADKAQGSLAKQFMFGQLMAEAARKVYSLVKNIFKDSIKEAAGYEQTVVDLNSAFTVSGRNMPGMVDGLKEYADELAGLGLAGDDVVMKMESVLLTMTHLDEDGIKAAVRGAIGLQKVYGGDLVGAAEAVGKAFEGNYGALSKMIPAIKNATTNEERHAIMLEEVDKAYKIAAGSTETYAGGVKKLGLEWDDTKRKFGESILQTGILQKALQVASDILNGDVGRHGSPIFIGVPAEIKACILAINPFLDSLETLKIKFRDAEGIALMGAAAWKSYSEGTKKTDEYLTKNKDTIVAWMKTGLESIGVLDKQTVAFNATGKAATGYTQEFIQARNDVTAQIEKATLSEYEAERQALIRTTALKIENFKATATRVEEGAEFEKLQNSALYLTLQDLAKNNAQKIAKIRSDLTTQILAYSTTQQEQETRAAELTFWDQAQANQKSMGNTKAFFDWWALAQLALRAKLKSIDDKARDESLALDKEIRDAVQTGEQKDIDGAANVAKQLFEIEKDKQKAKITTTTDTLKYTLWVLSEELFYATDNVKKQIGKTDEQKNAQIKILEDAYNAKKDLTIKEADTWGKMNEQIQADFIRAVGGILTGTQSIADSTKALLSSIANMYVELFVKEIVKAGFNMADGVNAALSKVGTSALGIIGIILTIISVVANVLDALGVFQSAGSKAAESFQSNLKNIQKEFQYLGEVSDKVAGEIARAMMKGATEAEAVAKNLGDMMRDTGIDMENFDIYLSKATNTLTLYEQGALTAAEATKLADDQFGQLIEAAKKLGTEGSEAMINFIKTSREMGLELASVNAYVITQLDKIPAALNTMIEASDNSAESLKGLGAIALTSFNGMIAAGVPWYEAVQAMAEPLAALAKKYKDLGLEADPALKELMKVIGVTEANKGLFDAISANDTILKALSNTGYLTAESLKVFTDNAQGYYAELIKNGMTEDQALHAMKISLQDIYDASVANGIPLDANTQKLVDQAKQAGLVKDKVDMGAVAEATLSVLERLEKMFERMFGFARDTKGTLESINGQTYGYNMAENWSTNNPGDSGGGGGGGGGTCFVAGTPIAMADGSKRPIEQIRIGDAVLGWDLANWAPVVGNVSALIRHAPEEVKQTVIINGSIRATPEHPFYINGVWKQVGDARIGDHLVASGGWLVDVWTKEWAAGGVAVYNLTLNNVHHDYFAGGVLVHNIEQKPEYGLGGFVPFTGPAYLHAGEYVIPPDQVAAMTSGAGGSGSPIGGNTMTVNINGPFVSSSGEISRSDIKKAGEEIFAEIQFQAGRAGMKLGHA